MTAIASHLPQPGSIAEMRQSALEDRLRRPFFQVVKLRGGDEIHVQQTEDGEIAMYLHERGGVFQGKELTPSEAGELEQALYMAREHVGGC